MAYKDYYLDPVGGSNANTGLLSTQFVQTWPRIHDVMVANPPGVGEVARVLVKPYNIITNNPGKPGNYTGNSAAGGTVTVPTTNGIVIAPYSTSDLYHATDMRLLSSTSDFTLVSGSIWRTSTTFAVAGLVNKVVRVWRAGSAGVLASMNGDNELFEATSYATLGSDDTHAWTQVDSGNTWSTSDTTPTSFSGMRTVYIYSPQGNPATVWGGLVFLTQETNFNLLMRMEDLDNWTLDEGFVFLGGGAGALRINGGSNWRVDAQFYAGAPYAAWLTLNGGAVSTNELQNCTISPRMDFLTREKPFYPIEAGHHNGGANDVVSLNVNARIKNLRFAAYATNGSRSVIRGGNHSGIGRPAATGSGYVNGLTVEPEFLFDGGGQQYCRGMAINGNDTNLTGLKIGGRVYNMRSPCQIHGAGMIKDYKSFNRMPMIPAARDATTMSGAVGSYTGRFGGTRNYGNVRTDGKWWDAASLSTFNSGSNVKHGLLTIIDCEFDNPMGPCITYSSDVTPAAGQLVTVANCLFRRGNGQGNVGCAVSLDTRNSSASGLRLLNNTEIGGFTNYTFNGTTRTQYALGSLPASLDKGWKSYATDYDYREAITRQVVQA